jgi:MerR family transcriptional regulator, redox-sensitive transcriptional activator SoxR
VSATSIDHEVGLKSRNDVRRTDEWPELTIGEVAHRAGVATSAIRYYESIGLLPEPERESGQRRYNQTVLGKLAFIGVAQTAGFKLAEIAELIEGLDGNPGMAQSMRSLSARKLPEIEALIERTEAMKGWLHVASNCDCETPAECSLFPAPGEDVAASADALRLIRVDGKGCRRSP